MTKQEIEFIEYWEKYLKSKVSIQTFHITQAFYIINGKPYNGSSCSSCMGQVAAQLKKSYEYLRGVYDKEKQADELTKQLIKQQTEEVSKPLKNNSRKSEENDKIKSYDNLTQEELEEFLLTDKQRKYAPHIKKGIITKKLKAMND